MSDYDYSLETLFRLYNDKTGSYVEVGPNADGLDGLYDLKYIESDGKEFCRLTLDMRQLNKLSEIFRTICLTNTPRG
jgi:hypothetical protein